MRPRCLIKFKWVPRLPHTLRLKLNRLQRCIRTAQRWIRAAPVSVLVPVPVSGGEGSGRGGGELLVPGRPGVIPTLIDTDTMGTSSVKAIGRAPPRRFGPAMARATRGAARGAARRRCSRRVPARHRLKRRGRLLVALGLADTFTARRHCCT